MNTLIADAPALRADHGIADDRAPEPLPDQEWCDTCAREETPSDDAEAGMPVDVVDVSVETDATWDAARLGPGPQYEVTRLACGHVLARLC